MRLNLESLLLFEGQLQDLDRAWLVFFSEASKECPRSMQKLDLTDVHTTLISLLFDSVVDLLDALVCTDSVKH